jgi:hypothetical protein
MKAHTPGPWSINLNVSQKQIMQNKSLVRPPGERASYRTIHPIKPDGTGKSKFPVAFIAGDPRPRHVNEANARLIAAAPDLLEILENILENVLDLNHVVLSPRVIHQARAVISKIEGESNVD